MYRYRDNGGTTKRSLKAAEKHTHKVGKIRYIRGYFYFGRYQTHHCGVIVRGDKGSARFGGFSWGYGGEGPRGLETFLKSINVPESEIRRVLAITWPNFNEAKECWRIDLDELTPAKAA